jgi:uncharacterized protein YgbK (DUF1537 family)
MVIKAKQLDQGMKDYVAAEVDAARQYSENLFKASSERVMAQLDEKLKTALATIRPPEAPKQTTIPLAEANAKELQMLAQSFGQAAAAYQSRTGLRVRHVVFEQHGGQIIVRPAVVNV